MVTAAPAYAAGSNGPWTVINGIDGVLSYRGNAAQELNNSGNHYFRFTITVPTGTTVTNPKATFTTAAAGNGFTVYQNNPSTVGSWSVSYDVTPDPKRAIFSQASLTAGVYTLSFRDGNTINEDDAPNPPSAIGSTFVFTSDNAFGPTVAFGVRASNQSGTTPNDPTLPGSTFIVSA